MHLTSLGKQQARREEKANEKEDPPGSSPYNFEVLLLLFRPFHLLRQSTLENVSTSSKPQA